MSDENPSIHEANKVVRVLIGEKLKYTVRIHKADGSVIEFQHMHAPTIYYDDNARALWLKAGDYSSSAPLMAYEAGMVILVEENPK